MGADDRKAIAPQTPTCWCRGRSLKRIRDDYAQCEQCGTLLYTEPYDPTEYQPAIDHDRGFYGEHYWRSRVPDQLRLPDLEERSHSDLTERAIFAVERILDRASAGGRLLELGCASGSLLFLLREAGFEVQGLEMSQYVADFAGGRFGVPVTVGTIEQTSADESWDVIVAIDVLEHLVNPLDTMSACRRHLAKRGLLFLQTPCYRSEGVDWSMFLPAEHLHLFGEESVRALLEAARFGWVEIRDSLFPYDMWIVAAASEPDSLPPGRTETTPVLHALKDARQRLEAAERRVEEVELDRDAHRKIASQTTAELLEIREDQSVKSELIERVSREVTELRQDQSAKAELIERISREVTELRQDQSAKAELIESIDRELGEVRADQAGKEELIQRLDRELEASHADQREKEATIERTRAELTQTVLDLAQLRNRWSVRVGTRLRRALGRRA